MLIQEKIAVVSIVLVAALHLVRLAASKFFRRTPEIACAGCGCAKTPGPGASLSPERISGSGMPSGFSRSQR